MLHFSHALVLAVALAGFSCCSLAETLVPEVATAVTTDSVAPPEEAVELLAPALLLPINTVIELQMLDGVSSATSKPGDIFRMRLAVPVKSGETVLLPAGTPVMGEVVHAAKAGLGGKAGELIVAARYVDAPQGPIKLRSSFGAAGKNNASGALAASFAIGPFAMAIRGKNLELPAGSALFARIAADTEIRPLP